MRFDSESRKFAEFASDPAQSRGRRYPQAASTSRTEFQRDRDRIIHCSAFRRLVYKTQVFLNHEGDLFRTRLTHSLEVAQLGRSMARALQLNEDLVEAIALAHDVGHTPFGHAGQDALNDCMTDWGGFEHNLQSLRVVDELEERYPDFNGLNLSFETREGILKHCSPMRARELEAGEPCGVGHRFLNHTRPSLEAQLCNLADEMAYNAHDIDDGVRSGLLAFEQLSEIPLFDRHRRQALDAHPSLSGADKERRLLYETLRRMLGGQVDDVIQTSRDALRAAAPDSANAVRNMEPLILLGADGAADAATLKRFLFHNLYRHAQVVTTTDLARSVIHDLFHAYQSAPDEVRRALSGMRSHALRQADALVPSEVLSPRRIADFVAGMTDRFALREHERLTGQRVLS